jgi:uncharacterized protein YggU (UPF0235/DUF167 family)
MKIQVKVKAGAKADCVSFDKEKNIYIVSTKVRPVEGRANAAVVKLLAGYLNVPKSQIKMKTGKKSKIKVFEIDR